MITQIDHIVIGVHDLDQAIADYSMLGFTVVPGGTHAGGQTHNALIGFQDGSYFELIAFVDPSRPADHRWWGPIAAGEGTIDFAVATDDAAAEASRMAEAGLPNDGPVDGGRDRPDGQRVGWRNLVLPGADDAGGPFVIEDTTPRDLRVPGGTSAQHAGGFQALDGLTIATPDLQASRRFYAALLGHEGTAIEPSVSGSGAAHRFTLGSHWIELNQPDDTDSPLAAAVRLRGATPWTVVLRTSDRSFASPDERLSHGARLELMQ
ncbi:MAG TPA: VOC family protein [Thermomicrobiales bacterium]|jgi:catechol 2,3-dioxygenase-like lactoylglutathione lyase family enzyme|nr:VOC family protein [Thermomicrobiales bacterium]